MRSFMLITILALMQLSGVAQASDAPTIADGQNPLIDYHGFVTLASDVGPLRQTRLVSLDRFAAMRADPRVLLLDARSERAFAEGHVAGAVNLPFSDFTAESLRSVIGDDVNRSILIYCNNNFTDNRRPVVTKKIELALNVQTFINLVGYGYTNVWELGAATASTDPRMAWVSAPQLTSVQR
jgi:phage shock protein E